MKTIDFESTVTLKDQIRDILREEISRGRYKPNDRLLPERDLAKIFGVNRHTVRKAILELVEEGLVSRRVSKGTFALSPAREEIGKDGITVTSSHVRNVPHRGELHEQMLGGVDERYLARHFNPADSSKAHVAVSMWQTFDEEVESYRVLPKLVKKRFPDTNLDITFYPGGAHYIEPVVSQLAKKVGPDLIMLEANNFPLFYEEGRLLNLNTFIEKDNYWPFVEGLFPKIRERFTVDGNLYVLPRDIAPVACLFYNQDLFDEANLSYPDEGWDWSKFLQAARKLTKRRRGKVIRYGFTGVTWLSFIFGNGGQIVDDVNCPKKCTFDNPDTIEGIRFYHDLINLYRVTPSPRELEILGDRNKMFIEGKAAMYLHSAFLGPLFQEKIKNFKWSFTLFPKSSESKSQRFYSGGSGFGINKDTRYPEDAWKVLKILTGMEAQMMFARKRLLQPSHMKTAERYWGKNSRKLPERIFNSISHQITFFPRSIKSALILNIISNQINLYFRNEQVLDETIKRIVHGVDDILQS